MKPAAIAAALSVIAVRCRTAAMREAAKQEARTVVDRIQAMKPTLCQPNQPC